MAAVRSNWLEAFALAVKVCTDRYPEDFGAIDNWQAYEAKVEALRSQRDELFRRIAKECSGSDLDVKDAGQGMAIISFAMTQGEVSLHPMSDTGERLVNWMMSRR